MPKSLRRRYRSSPYSKTALCSRQSTRMLQLLCKARYFYRWNADKQVLSLYGANDSYIIFTMDSNKAQTNKGEITLKGTPKLMDGIPMIEIDSMANALGLKLTVDGNKYTLVNHYASRKR